MAKLFTPKAVTVLSTDSESINTHVSDTATSPYLSDLHSHPLYPVLLMLSDLFHLFEQTSKSPANHITHKLLFYAAHVISLPAAVISSLVGALSVRAEKLRAEAATQVESASKSGGLERPLTVGHSLVIGMEPESVSGNYSSGKAKDRAKSDLGPEQMVGSGSSNGTVSSDNEVSSKAAENEINKFSDAEGGSQAQYSRGQTKVFIEEI